TGLLYGLFGGLLAWLLITVAVWILAPSIGTLAQLYGSDYVLRGPDTRDVGLLIGSGALLGLIGAWISATRHIARIEPRA
ncbi:MAG TPA: hypothetical protein VIL32_02160, partial [Steroidobacteraceae bacterium]